MCSTSNNRCQCIGNTIFQNGRCVPPPTRPPPPPPRPTCLPGQQYLNGRCQCPSNTVYENGRCVTITPPPPPPIPHCGAGQQYINGRCITITTPIAVLASNILMEDVSLLQRLVQPVHQVSNL
ncbi:hypothetical protein QE152_g3630 [Popillia japonica]|uniref:EB domain-containing protein n=1 Tax=Popillia japonica TaxID=7064 RepID=A0AAW1N3E9_POPJA